jgi:hypothetical protein
MRRLYSCLVKSRQCHGCMRVARKTRNIYICHPYAVPKAPDHKHALGGPCSDSDLRVRGSNLDLLADTLSINMTFPLEEDDKIMNVQASPNAQPARNCMHAWIYQIPVSELGAHLPPYSRAYRVLVCALCTARVALCSHTQCAWICTNKWRTRKSPTTLRAVRCEERLSCVVIRMFAVSRRCTCSTTSSATSCASTWRPHWQ